MSKLTEKIKKVLHGIGLKYHTKEGSLHRYGSYVGLVKLMELLPTVTIASYQKDGGGHIMLFNKSIEEIKKDQKNTITSISPVAMFILQDGFVFLKPFDEGRSMVISDMEKDIFDTFIALQRLLRQ